MRTALEYASSIWCCCCLPTPPYLFGGVLPYFEVTGHPVPVSSLKFKCPDCFIRNYSYIVYPSKMKGPFRDNCLRYFYLRVAFLMAGCVEDIRRALVLGLGRLLHHVSPISKKWANSIFGRSFVYAAPTLWNDLDIDI